MRRRTICACLVLLIAGCNREAAHLPPLRMAPIVTDLHLADAYSGLIRDSTHPATGKNYDSLAVWTAQIFAKYHVTAQEFNRSMDWYRDRPAELDSLYAAVTRAVDSCRKK